MQTEIAKEDQIKSVGAELQQPTLESAIKSDIGQGPQDLPTNPSPVQNNLNNNANNLQQYATFVEDDQKVEDFAQTDERQKNVSRYAATTSNDKNDTKMEQNNGEIWTAQSYAQQQKNQVTPSILNLQQIGQDDCGQQDYDAQQNEGEMTYQVPTQQFQGVTDQNPVQRLIKDDFDAEKSGVMAKRRAKTAPRGPNQIRTRKGKSKKSPHLNYETARLSQQPFIANIEPLDEHEESQERGVYHTRTFDSQENDGMGQDYKQNEQEQGHRKTTVTQEINRDLNFFKKRYGGTARAVSYRNRLKDTLIRIQSPKKNRNSLLYRATMPDATKIGLGRMANVQGSWTAAPFDQQKIGERMGNKYQVKGKIGAINSINQIYNLKIGEMLFKAAQGLEGGRARRRQDQRKALFSQFKRELESIQVNEGEGHENQNTQQEKDARKGDEAIEDPQIVNEPNFMQDTISSFTQRALTIQAKKKRKVKKSSFKAEEDQGLSESQAHLSVFYQQPNNNDDQDAQTNARSSMQSLIKNQKSPIRLVKNTKSPRNDLNLIGEDFRENASDPVINFDSSKTPPRTPQQPDKAKFEIKPSNFSNADYINDYKRSTGFTGSFNNVMFRDHSLFAASREQVRKVVAPQQRQRNHERDIEKLRSMQAKRNIAEHYLIEHEIESSSKDIERLSEQQLLIKLESKCLILKEMQAAIRIQALGRMFIHRVAHLRRIEARHEAACRIQRCFRNYRRWSSLPKVWKLHKRKMAILLQKYLRGYIVFHRNFLQIRQAKIKENIIFFDIMKNELEETSANLVQRNLRQYLQHTRREKAKIEAKTKKGQRKKTQLGGANPKKVGGLSGYQMSSNAKIRQNQTTLNRVRTQTTNSAAQQQNVEENKDLHQTQKSSVPGRQTGTLTGGVQSGGGYTQKAQSQIRNSAQRLSNSGNETKNTPDQPQFQQNNTNSYEAAKSTFSGQNYANLNGAPGRPVMNATPQNPPKSGQNNNMALSSLTGKQSNVGGGAAGAQRTNQTNIRAQENNSSSLTSKQNATHSASIMAKDQKTVTISNNFERAQADVRQGSVDSRASLEQTTDGKLNVITGNQTFSVDNQSPSKQGTHVRIQEEDGESKAFDTSTSPMNTSAIVSKRQSIEGNLEKEPVKDKIAIKQLTSATQIRSSKDLQKQKSSRSRLEVKNQKGQHDLVRLSFDKKSNSQMSHSRLLTPRKHNTNSSHSAFSNLNLAEAPRQDRQLKHQQHDHLDLETKSISAKSSRSFVSNKSRSRKRKQKKSKKDGRSDASSRSNKGGKVVNPTKQQFALETFSSQNDRLSLIEPSPPAAHKLVKSNSKKSVGNRKKSSKRLVQVEIPQKEGQKLEKQENEQAEAGRLNESGQSGGIYVKRLSQKSLAKSRKSSKENLLHQISNLSDSRGGPPSVQDSKILLQGTPVVENQSSYLDAVKNENEKVYFAENNTHEATEKGHQKGKQEGQVVTAEMRKMTSEFASIDNESSESGDYANDEK